MDAKRGATIWLTGLPCSGKTTLAGQLAARLSSRGEHVEVLDGDVIRTHLSSHLGFSREDRDANVRRVAFVAGLLAKHGITVIVAMVSPYRASREALRASLEPLLEVFVSCALAECERRDVKGMYRRARAGQLRHFTGIDDPYEPPLAADITLRTDVDGLEDCTAALENVLLERGLIAPRYSGLGTPNTPTHSPSPVEQFACR